MYKINKIILNRNDYAKLRKMFFINMPYEEIKKAFKCSSMFIIRMAKKYNWYKKRERYYKYICFCSYNNRISIVKICNEMGLNYNILKRIKQKYNIKTKKFTASFFPEIPHNKRITKKIELDMIKDYKNGKNTRFIANKYGFKKHKTVCDVLKKYNIDRRPGKKQTYYNEKMFYCIDSEQKAYILGMLLTDGYIIKNYSGVGIQLTIEDKYILEKIAPFFGISTKITDIDCSHKRIKMPNVKDMARLSCYCPSIARDLKNLCVVRNKSKILECPKIKKEFLGSFCRGLIDGDGSIGVAKTKNIWIKLSSASINFCNGFVKLVPEFSFKIYKTPLICNVVLAGGNKESIRFLKWIYENKGDLYLRRKYEKVQNYIN